MATKPYEIQDIDKKMPAVIQSLKDKENPFSYKSVSSLQASEAAKKGEWRLAVWCPDETTAKKRAKDLNARACIGERTLPPMPKAEKPGSPVQQMVDFKVEEAKKPKAPGKDGMRGAGYTGKGVKQGKGQPMNKLRASADELDLVLYVAVPKKFTEGVDLNGVYVNDLNSDLQGQIIARAQDAQVYLSEGNIDASLKASSLKEGDVLQHEDGKPYGRVYNVSPNWIALMDENNKKTMHLPGDLEEDLESGAIKIVSSLKADYTGACAECGKNVGSANITMSGAPGKRYCSQACVDAAYKKQSPTDKKKVKAAKRYKVGDKVFWKDPDSVSSGNYTVIEGVDIDEGEEVSPEDIITIKNKAGSVAEVTVSELRPANKSSEFKAYMADAANFEHGTDKGDQVYLVKHPGGEQVIMGGINLSFDAKKKVKAESDRAKMSGSKIKADDIGRADDEEEESWDTAEVSRWIANDESLYLAARGVRNAREMEETLQPMMEGNKHIDVDWNEIDWQAVYNDMDNADTDVEGQAQRRAQAGRIFTARAKHPMRYARMRASRMKASEDDEAKAKQFMKHIISRLTKKLAKGNYENFGQEELSDFEEYLSKTSGLGYSQKANLKSELSKQIEDMQ